MKLASYRDGSRDGQLVVVSRDLSTAHYASGIASRLQQVLDDWNFLAPQLEDLSRELNAGRARHAFVFDARQCLAPLPRAYQWALAQAYPSHVERLAGAGAAAPSQDAGPGVQQSAGDALFGACDDVVVSSEALEIDFGAGLAVITGDVERGASAEQARAGVRLVMLASSVHLRRLEAHERASGHGLQQSAPATAFGPVAVTPDELGAAWSGARVHLALQSSRNGRRFGRCEAGAEMACDFGALIAHLARTRALGAGAIVGGGTVSNQDAGRGFGCIAEKRSVETQQEGTPRTDYLHFGERVHVDMKGLDGLSVCGAIEQQIGAGEQQDGSRRGP